MRKLRWKWTRKVIRKRIRKHTRKGALNRSRNYPGRWPGRGPGTRPGKEGRSRRNFARIPIVFAHFGKTVLMSVPGSPPGGVLGTVLQTFAAGFKSLFCSRFRRTFRSVSDRPSAIHSGFFVAFPMLLTQSFEHVSQPHLLPYLHLPHKFCGCQAEPRSQHDRDEIK